MYEAENEQLLGRIIEIEKLQGVIRLLQTQIVLLEWLIPLLEDLRISRSNLDIIRMLKDNLMGLEWSCSIDPVKCEDRYLHGITEHWRDEISLYSTLYEAIFAIMSIGDGVPDKSGKRE